MLLLTLAVISVQGPSADRSETPKHQYRSFLTIVTLNQFLLQS